MEIDYKISNGEAHYYVPVSNKTQVVTFSDRGYIFHLHKIPPVSKRVMWWSKHYLFNSIKPKVELNRFGSKGKISTELFYIHIMKCGGSSIEAVGYDHGVDWGYIHKLLSRSDYKHHDPDSVREIKDKVLFTTVRNPYDRLISVLPNKDQIKTKEEFNNKLREKLNLNSIEMSPCYDFVYHNDRKIIPHVIKMEDGLNEGFNKLMFEYNCSVRLNNIHVNKSSVGEKKWCVDDINPANIDLINKRYEKDFKYFGYTIK